MILDDFIGCLYPTQRVQIKEVMEDGETRQLFAGRLMRFVDKHEDLLTCRIEEAYSSMVCTPEANESEDTTSIESEIVIDLARPEE